MSIVPDQLLSCFVLDRHHLLEEFDKFSAILRTAVEKIEAVLSRANSDGVLEHVVF